VQFRVAAPLVVLYFVAYLDRVNISFAALTMNRDLGLSESVFGLASGIFFLGYMLFAVPSNIMVAKFGPRHWMAALMVTWGLLSGSTAFVHSGAMYVVIRFLIGAAEAGFFPGIVYYLTRWLPTPARAGILSLFMLSIPLSSIVGSPISARIMQLSGAGGLAGWQWLFLLEAFPAVLLGCLTPWLLIAGPRQAKWLNDDEVQRLEQAIEDDRIACEGQKAGADAGPMPVKTITLAAVVYFCFTTGLYELGFWVPRLLTSHGVKLASVGWLTSLPFVAGAVGMYVWSRWSDRTNERRVNHAASLLMGACGLLITAFAPSVAVTVLGLSIAGAGIFASLPIFWAGFSQRVSAAHAAFGIAMVNSLGNIGGLAGPYVTGVLLERTHSYVSGLLVIAIALTLGAVIGLMTTKRVVAA